MSEDVCHYVFCPLEGRDKFIFKLQNALLGTYPGHSNLVTIFQVLCVFVTLDTSLETPVPVELKFIITKHNL